MVTIEQLRELAAKADYEISAAAHKFVDFIEMELTKAADAAGIKHDADMFHNGPNQFESQSAPEQAPEQAASVAVDGAAPAVEVPLAGSETNAS